MNFPHRIIPVGSPQSTQNFCAQIHFLHRFKFYFSQPNERRTKVIILFEFWNRELFKYFFFFSVNDSHSMQNNRLKQWRFVLLPCRSLALDHGALPLVYYIAQSNGWRHYSNFPQMCLLLFHCCRISLSKFF